MLDLERFCALCGKGYSRVHYYDEDDLDTMEDCSCREGDSWYGRKLRREAKLRPACQWFEEQGDPLYGEPVVQGPVCGKPAKYKSCMPYTGSFTCEAHKCRCATPLP